MRQKHQKSRQIDSIGVAKHAKLLRNHPQNTDTENTQITRLRAVGYSVFPQVFTPSSAQMKYL